MVIKQCKNTLDEKNRSRWLEEIKWMNKIKHRNVVGGLPIPIEIEQFIKAPEKLLGLEFCESDLRKVGCILNTHVFLHRLCLDLSLNFLIKMIEFRIFLFPNSLFMYIIFSFKIYPLYWLNILKNTLPLIHKYCKC